MIEFSVAQIAEAMDGRIVGIDPAETLSGPVVTDSREAVPGAIYVARRGENLDGHEFSAAAVAAGARLVIAEEAVAGGTDLPSVLVEDSTVALGRLATANVERLRDARRETAEPLSVVAITGSAGKTTTKDLIADLLVSQGPTVWPPNSFNNEVGVPLTALRAGRDTRYLVLEMGAKNTGHIAYLASVIRPDVAVELNVGSAHRGVFGSIEATAAAKRELVESLIPGGIAVLNLDDPRVAAMKSAAGSGVDCVWFSASADSGDGVPTLWAEDVRTDATGRSSFTLCFPDGQSAEVRLALLGEHHVSNALAAAAVAWRLGVPPATIVTVLKTSGAASRWRMELVDSAAGVTVINDAYNASPDAMRSALKTLAVMGRGDASTPPRRTWAVIGEMLDLGDNSIAEHDAIGRLVVRLNISRLLAVGEGARPVYQAAHLEGSWGDEAAWVPDVAAAREFLESELRSGDLVLFKSSRDSGLRHLGDEVAGVSA